MPKIRQADGSFIDIDLSNIFDDSGENPFVVPPVTEGATFTAADIERVRAEEKNKLYGRIEELSTKVEQFTGQLTAQQQAEKDRLEAEQAQAQAAARAAEEADLDAKSLIERRQAEWQQQLAQTNQSWEQKFAEIQQERDAASALAAKEREFNEVGDYARASIEANKENIAPQLLQFVRGNTKEEIDASISQAIQSTNDILTDIREAQGGAAPAIQQFAAPGFSGVRTFGGPGNTDPAGSQSQTYTPEQINAMSMTEYAEFRRKIGVGGQSSSQGLYG